MLKKIKLMLFLLLAAHSFGQIDNPNAIGGYKVWLGTTATPKSSVTNKENWSTTAKYVQGLNINKTPIRPDLGTPTEGEESLSLQQFNKMVRTYDLGKDNGFKPLTRSGWYHPDFPIEEGKEPRDDLELHLQKKFEAADVGGYAITGIMFFDNFQGSDAATKIVYKWTEAEVQRMRVWLDANRPGVRLFYNMRNFGVEAKAWVENTLVDDIVFEAEPSKWYDNKGSRQDLLEWVWENELLDNKRLIFQVPVSAIHDSYGTPNSLQQMREWVRWLGVELMGIEFLRSDRVVFLPVVYNNPTFPFSPETIDNGTTYANTATGIALSLIEQRAMFQGLSGVLPTEADALDITRDESLSTNDFTINSYSINLFPNPINTGDIVSLKGITSPENIEITVYDIYGNRMNIERKATTIKVSNASSGIYVVRFYYKKENQFVSKKLIIK